MSRGYRLSSMAEADVASIVTYVARDNLDAALIHLLAERFKCTQAVGVYKAAHNFPAADPAREAAQIARLRRLAAEAKLDPDFAEKFFNFVVTEVIRHHEAIRSSKS